MKYLILSLLLAAALVGCAGSEEKEEDALPFDLGMFDKDEGESCINRSRIDSMDVLSDRVILFKMKGGGDYLNILPHRCPGMRPNRPLMYRTQGNQLCHLEIIRVLDSSAGGLQPIGACGLGKFHKVPVGMPLVVEDEPDEE